MMHPKSEETWCMSFVLIEFIVVKIHVDTKG